MNSTSNQTDEVSAPEFYLYIYDTVQAAVTCSLNGILGYVVLKKPTLRNKGYLILIPQALGDFVYSFGTLLGQPRRIYLMSTGLASEPRTAWECMLAPPTIFFLIGKQANGIAMLQLAADRLYAVCTPFGYRALSENYAWTIVYAFVGYCATATIVAFAASFMLTDHDTRGFNAQCFSNWAVPQWYAGYANSLAMVGGAGSVALYGVTVALYQRYYRRRAAALEDREKEKQELLRDARRLTVAVGITTLITVICFLIPYMFVTLLSTVYADLLSPEMNHVVTSYLFSLIRLNIFCNAIVYITRLQEVRKQILLLFGIKPATVGTASVNLQSRNIPINSIRAQNKHT